MTTAVEIDVAPAALMLSFVALDNYAINFWAPQRDGDYEVDCARGRAYAHELVTYMRHHRNPTILGSVMRSITTGGVYEGVEIGFSHQLALSLVSDIC